MVAPLLGSPVEVLQVNIPSIPTPYILPLKLTGLALVLVGVGYAGWHLRDLDFQAYKGRQAVKHEKAAEQVRTVETRSQGISQVARDKHDSTQAEVRVVYRNIQEKVPVYVPTTPADSWSLPVGAGRLLDYAALGLDPPVPAPSGEPLGAATGIELPAFVSTVAGNYGVCRGWRAEVMTWREWYAEQVKAWGK